MKSDPLSVVNELLNLDLSLDQTTLEGEYKGRCPTADFKDTETFSLNGEQCMELAEAFLQAAKNIRTGKNIFWR